MGPFDAIIFDMDGTLLDTLDDLTDSINYALGRMGWPMRTREEVRYFVGRGSEALIQRAAPPGVGKADLDRLLAIYKPYYAAHAQDKTAPYPGIHELLKALRDRGIKTAVVSNKFDRAVKKLANFYFPNLLSAAVGEDEAHGVLKKPDPTMAVESAALLGARRAVYVGDSDVDLLTAANAGLPCVSVTWGFRDEEFLTAHGATTLIHTPMELLSFVK